MDQVSIKYKELPTTTDGEGKILKIGSELVFETEDYKEGLLIHAGPDSPQQERAGAYIEIVTKDGETLPKDSYIDLHLLPASGNREFKLINPHVKSSMSVWTLERETKIEPAGELVVKESFYAMVGQNYRVEFSFQNSGVLSVKTSEISKENSGYKDFKDKEKNIEDNKDVDVYWNMETSEKSGLMQSIDFGSGDTCQVKTDSGSREKDLRITIDYKSDKIIFDVSKGAEVWLRAEEGNGSYTDGTQEINAGLYFAVDGRLFYYVGRRDNNLKILEVMR